ncbi:galactan endo-1,6-beta-galactosidase [Catenulispora sp. EB89]|uniref:glycoside hydrolase n=1 Tax=Catenulispora sp. EB89 TaxID=3156257 RepID=UPI00351535C6
MAENSMRRRTLLAASATTAASAAAFSTLGVSAANADYTTTVDPGTSWGTWEGWGTSLAWWAKAFGNRDDIADIFFTLNSAPYNGGTLPGLGLTIVRYNAGACSWNSIGGTTMVQGAAVQSTRQMEGYWLDWYSQDPASASWNWYVDAPQRNMLWKARDRGVNHFELFSNSPMWWMCYNHNPSGSADGTSDNLQSWNYQQHAVYLATIAKYAHDNWGFQFTSVEAFNEPVSGWWKADSSSQEGCHFNVSTQATVINYLRAELNSRGLTGTPVASSDENTYDEATATFQGLGGTAQGNVGKINTHGYQYGGGRRDLLYDAAKSAGKVLWNSEYGEGDASGMSLASNLNLDLTWLHPTAWVYWQVLDGGGWGAIQCDEAAGTTGAVNPKYYVLAQFTRHIRPGMRLIDSGDHNSVAAYDPVNHKLVIVCTNYGTAQWINFDLSKFTTVTGSGGNGLVGRWATQTAGGDAYTYHADTFLHGKVFWSWFTTNTVQSFEIDGVYL